MTIDLFGIGNPIMDILMNISYETFASLGITAGSMNLLQDSSQAKELGSLNPKQVLHSGGSVANTIFMVSQLGLPCAFQGSIGNDELGNEYARLMEQQGIRTYFAKSTKATATSTILITPDGQRTMNTYLGACLDFAPDKMNTQDIAKAKLIYISGYMWDTPKQQEAIKEILVSAKELSIPVAFTLSDIFCVERHKETFRSLIKDYVSLVFCNQEEAASLTDKTTLKEQTSVLTDLCSEVIITQGKAGALLIKEKEEFSQIALSVPKVIDTTGAGDSFAAGYLYGKLTNQTPQACLRLASACASVIIQQIGARFSGDFKQALISYLATI